MPRKKQFKRRKTSGDIVRFTQPFFVQSEEGRKGGKRKEERGKRKEEKGRGVGHPSRGGNDELR